MYENLALETLTEVIRLENNTGARWSFILEPADIRSQLLCNNLVRCNIVGFSPTRQLALFSTRSQRRSAES